MSGEAEEAALAAAALLFPFNHPHDPLLRQLAAWIAYPLQKVEALGGDVAGEVDGESGSGERAGAGGDALPQRGLVDNSRCVRSPESESVNGARAAFDVGPEGFCRAAGLDLEVVEGSGGVRMEAAPGPVIARPLCSPSTTPTIRCSAKWQLGSLIPSPIRQRPMPRLRSLLALVIARFSVHRLVAPPVHAALRTVTGSSTKMALVAVSTAVLGSTASANGTWLGINRTYVPGIDTPPPAVCTGGFGHTLGVATSAAYSNGTSCAGAGSAFDASWGCDVLNIANAIGLVNETWTYKAEREPGQVEGGSSSSEASRGRATVTARVEVGGAAHLTNAACAAAALGYAEFTCSLTAPLEAKLLRSAGETRSGQLGTIGGSHGGLSGSVNVSVGLGEGTYPDSDINATSAQDCLNYFFIQHRSRAYIKVWANAGLDPLAECSAVMWGRVSASAVLDTCPQ